MHRCNTCTATPANAPAYIYMPIIGVYWRPEQHGDTNTHHPARYNGCVRLKWVLFVKEISCTRTEYLSGYVFYFPMCGIFFFVYHYLSYCIVSYLGLYPCRMHRSMYIYIYTHSSWLCLWCVHSLPFSDGFSHRQPGSRRHQPSAGHDDSAR